MPHPLTYDTLPAGSTLRREVADGVLTITAAAQVPDAQMKRRMRQRSALPAAMLSGAMLVAFIAAFGSTYLAHRRHIGAALGVVLFVAFVVFCSALFLFTWKAQFGARIDVLERALKETTILAASPGRLQIETSGPRGSASYDLPSEALNLRIARSSVHPPHLCLEIVARDGIAIQLLAGREEAELRWVSHWLQAALSTG